MRRCSSSATAFGREGLTRSHRGRLAWQPDAAWLLRLARACVRASVPDNVQACMCGGAIKRKRRSCLSGMTHICAAAGSAAMHVGSSGGSGSVCDHLLHDSLGHQACLYAFLGACPSYPVLPHASMGRGVLHRAAIAAAGATCLAGLQVPEHAPGADARAATCWHSSVVSNCTGRCRRRRSCSLHVQRRPYDHVHRPGSQRNPCSTCVGSTIWQGGKRCVYHSMHGRNGSFSADPSPLAPLFRCTPAICSTRGGRKGGGDAQKQKKRKTQKQSLRAIECVKAAAARVIPLPLATHTKLACVSNGTIVGGGGHHALFQRHEARSTEESHVACCRHPAAVTPCRASELAPTPWLASHKHALLVLWVRHGGVHSGVVGILQPALAGGRGDGLQRGGQLRVQARLAGLVLEQAQILEQVLQAGEARRDAGPAAARMALLQCIRP